MCASRVAMPDDPHTAASHDLIALARGLGNLAVAVAMHAGAIHDAGGPRLDDHLARTAATLREAADRVDTIRAGL